MTIDKYTGTDTAVVIPDTIEGKPVTGIKGYAFNGTSVTSVTLPSGMTRLSDYAFYGATKLTSVTIPSNITSIGSYAFEFCTSLKSITIPGSVTAIYNGAFCGCTSLANVYMYQGLKTIGAYAFENTALTKITIPKTVTTMGDYSVGYNYSNSTYTGVTGFTMTGYAYTAAETYANNNPHITFNPQYESITNTSTISATNITLGGSVTVNCSATGGKKPLQYGVTYTLNGTTYPIQGYSTNATVNFTPSSAGTYTVTVNAKDDRGYYASKSFTLTVALKPVINNSTIGQSAITEDETVVVTTGASGGIGGYKYSIYYHNKGSNNWQTAADQTTRNSVAFRLVDENGEALKGLCEVVVYAYDADERYQAKTFDVTVYDRLINDSMISAETVNVGDDIVISAYATGGSGGYTYLYSYSGDGDWIDVADGPYDSWTFTPGSAGNYHYKVVVTDSDGRSEEKTFDVTVAEAKQELVNTTQFSAESITVGGSVVFHASAIGGTAPYTYAVLSKQSTSTKWFTNQNFSANADVELTFDEAGSYDVCVKVKDKDGTVAKKYFTVTVNEAVTALANTSTLSADTVQAGGSVTVNASATGGTAPYTYNVLSKLTSSTKWTTNQNYAANASVAITFDAAGTYDICVKAKDKAGTVDKKYFTVTVTAATELTNTSKISSETAVIGGSVSITASAVGGEVPYSYAVYSKKTSASSWKTERGFDGESSISVTFSEEGTYEICVKAKDDSGAVAKKYFTVTVTG